MQTHTQTNADEAKKPVCPECKTGQIYVKSDKTIRCFRCGYTGPMERDEVNHAG